MTGSRATTSLSVRDGFGARGFDFREAADYTLSTMKVRREKDSLGTIAVPAAAYRGAFTQRALENFPISGSRPDMELFRSIAKIKIAAAEANVKLGVLPRRIGEAISRAGREVVDGKFDGEFVLDAFTAGAGTPFHMNVNEVIANRANEILGGELGVYDHVHPNDHVNLGQSSNDVIPTAIRIAALKLLEEAIPKLDLPAKTCRKLGARFRGLLKSARTHLQDAVPITLGQELMAYAQSLEKGTARIRAASVSVRLLGIGATAAGTGINAHPGYSILVVKNLRRITGLPLGNAKDLVEATSSMADLMELANALDEHAIELNRLCNDLRLLASGPRTGLDELRLPEVEPGSSIMPGKVNPSIPEMVNMVSFQVFGAVQTVRHAVMGGQLDLNVFTPSIALNLLGMIRILGSASLVLARGCLDGLAANRDALRGHFERSAGIATALTPEIGYNRAAGLVKKAIQEGRSVREVLEAESGLDAKTLERLLDPSSITRPNLRPKRRPS
ncbi:MAG TPA: aspartate ammonia-lyase [Planctomycetota bacterium]|nr:aspartate ammonia-lyase [Planctomycetota bacterium]